jgi:hypothetical protein
MELTVVTGMASFLQAEGRFRWWWRSVIVGLPVLALHFLLNLHLLLP